MDCAAEAGLMKRIINVPIPLGDFKKHISVPMKHKWQAEWDEAINNILHVIHPQLGLWPGGFRGIKHDGHVLSRIRIGHSH